MSSGDTSKRKGGFGGGGGRFGAGSRFNLSSVTAKSAGVGKDLVPVVQTNRSHNSHESTGKETTANEGNMNASRAARGNSSSSSEGSGGRRRGASRWSRSSSKRDRSSSSSNSSRSHSSASDRYRNSDCGKHVPSSTLSSETANNNNTHKKKRKKRNRKKNRNEMQMQPHKVTSSVTATTSTSAGRSELTFHHVGGQPPLSLSSSSYATVVAGSSAQSAGRAASLGPTVAQPMYFPYSSAPYAAYSADTATAAYGGTASLPHPTSTTTLPSHYNPQLNGGGFGSTNNNNSGGNFHAPSGLRSFYDDGRYGGVEGGGTQGEGSGGTFHNTASLSLSATSTNSTFVYRKEEARSYHFDRAAFHGAVYGGNSNNNTYELHKVHNVDADVRSVDSSSARLPAAKSSGASSHDDEIFDFQGFAANSALASVSAPAIAPKLSFPCPLSSSSPSLSNSTTPIFHSSTHQQSPISASAPPTREGGHFQHCQVQTPPQHQNLNVVSPTSIPISTLLPPSSSSSSGSPQPSSNVGAAEGGQGQMVGVGGSEGSSGFRRPKMPAVKLVAKVPMPKPSSTQAPPQKNNTQPQPDGGSRRDTKEPESSTLSFSKGVGIAANQADQKEERRKGDVPYSSSPSPAKSDPKTSTSTSNSTTLSISPSSSLGYDEKRSSSSTSASTCVSSARLELSSRGEGSKNTIISDNNGGDVRTTATNGGQSKLKSGSQEEEDQKDDCAREKLLSSNSSSSASHAPTNAALTDSKAAQKHASWSAPAPSTRIPSITDRFPLDYLWTCSLADFPTETDLSFYDRSSQSLQCAEEEERARTGRVGGDTDSSEDGSSNSHNARNKNNINTKKRGGGASPFTLHEENDILYALVERLPYEYLNRNRHHATIPERLIRSILLAAREILMSEPLVLQLPAPMNICGDIHGQYEDLLNMFAREPPLKGKVYKAFAKTTTGHAGGAAAAGSVLLEAGKASSNKTVVNNDGSSESKSRTVVAGPQQQPYHRSYLFLGDYVDRGLFSLEVIVTLMALKILAPNEIYLLRGNHESAAISKRYGFFDECKRRYLNGPSLWKLCMDVFMCLPVSAIVGDAIFCTHGGISPELESVQQLIACPDPRPFDTPASGVFCDLLWSDPVPDPQMISGWTSNERGVSYCWGADVLDLFLERNGLDLLCRGHQVMEQGYGFFPYYPSSNNNGTTNGGNGGVTSSRRAVTVFSASDYGGDFGNCAAMMIVGEDLCCGFHVFRYPSIEVRRILRQGVTDADIAPALRKVKSIAFEYSKQKQRGENVSGEAGSSKTLSGAKTKVSATASSVRAAASAGSKGEGALRIEGGAAADGVDSPALSSCTTESTVSAGTPLLDDGSSVDSDNASPSAFA